MSTRPYTPASVLRALEHHVRTGALRSFRRLPETTDCWRVEFADASVPTVASLTLAQLYALAVGLAAGEKRWKSIEA